MNPFSLKDRIKRPKEHNSANFAELFYERIFVSIMIAYADESGIHDPTGVQHGSEIAVVCGYLSYKEHWDKFCIDWQNELNKNGVKVFHMSEFMDRINAPRKANWPYKGWSEEKRDSFIRTLISIAKSNILLGVGGVLNVRDYDKMSPGWFKDEVEHSYYFCFQLFFDCLLPMLEQFDEPLSPDEQVSFFFDQTKQFETIASKAFHQIKDLRDTKDRMGSLAFVSKKIHKPLQAADLLAYLMRSAQTRKIKTGNNATPPGNWEEDLVSDRNVKMCYYDASNLPQIIENLFKDRLRLIRELLSDKKL